MSDYREFQGKTLDEAIRDACAFYDSPREKLEIDIISDAKGGIFGLVGARKALIRARQVELGSVFDELDVAGGRKEEPARAPATPAAPKAPAEKGRRDSASSPQSRPASAPKVAPSAPAAAETAAEAAQAPHRERQSSSRRGRGRKGSAAAETAPVGAPVPQPEKRPGKEGQDARSRRNRPQETARTASAGNSGSGGKRREQARPDGGAGKAELFPADAGDGGGEELPRVPFDQLDSDSLLAVTREVAKRLTFPLLGDANIEVVSANDRVRVSISGLEDPGLLIGRDGQTLSSLQYLATRMVSNRMNALVRVQIDAGDYRERQDERLRDLAFSLAEKVKSGGKPQLTRPLSSYHRRVIHLTLQDDPAVQTHSKGEGEMKRVAVTLRRKQDKPA